MILIFFENENIFPFKNLNHPVMPVSLVWSLEAESCWREPGDANSLV